MRHDESTAAAVTTNQEDIILKYIVVSSGFVFLLEHNIARLHCSGKVDVSSSGKVQDYRLFLRMGVSGDEGLRRTIRNIRKMTLLSTPAHDSNVKPQFTPKARHYNVTLSYRALKITATRRPA